MKAGTPCLTKTDFSRLLIVSHVIHYEYAGRLHAYGPYAREIEVWADLFPTVTIASPLRREEPPKDCVPFHQSNIVMTPQLETGGDTLPRKLLQLLLLPVHLCRLAAAMLAADAVHVRCPGNLGLLGALLAPLCCKRSIAKYAGQWHGAEHVPLTFRIQRWILSSRWWRNGVVTVYGEWPGQPPQVFPFFTSMMTRAQVRRAACAAESKRLESPLRILYSGRLAPKKGVDLLLQALASVPREIAWELTVLGDGPERDMLEQVCRRLNLQDRVLFAGAVPFDEVMGWYERCHVLVLASNTEGWPKVIVEAMCHGVVGIGTDQGLMPWMLQGRGATVPMGDCAALASAIARIASDPERYRELSRNAACWAERYSLEGLRDALRELLCKTWDIELKDRAELPAEQAIADARCTALQAHP